MATARISGLTGGPAMRRPARKPLKYPWSERGTAPATTPLLKGPITAGTPAAPGPQAPPVDPQLTAQLGGAQRQKIATLLGTAYERQQLGPTFGLGLDAGGSVIDDPSNPYSRAAQMLESYKRAQAGNTNALAARGQLYSGAHQNAQNESGRQYSIGRDDLIRQFLATNQSIGQRELAARNAFTDATTQARSDALARATAARPDAATVPPAAEAKAPALPKIVTKGLPKAKPKKRPKARR